MPILTSAVAFVLTWIFWLAASISVTVSTADGRSFCSNLNDLTNDPELKDLDPELLSEFCMRLMRGISLMVLWSDMAKKALKSACSEIHASLAFSWMSFVLATFMAIGLLALGLRERRNGNHHVRRESSLVNLYSWFICTQGDAWKLSVIQENGRAVRPESADPFADPVEASAPATVAK